MKIPLAYLFFFLTINSISFAQRVSQTESALASAYFLLPLSITATAGELDFGEIILTGSNFTTSINPFSGKIFIVNGQPGRDIMIGFSSSILNNNNWVSSYGGQLGSLEFNPDVRLSNNNIVLSGDTQTLIFSSGIGELVLNVGGSIDIQSNQPTGNYEGQFTITVAY